MQITDSELYYSIFMAQNCDGDHVRATIILIDEKWQRIRIVLFRIYHNNSSEN